MYNILLFALTTARCHGWNRDWEMVGYLCITRADMFVKCKVKQRLYKVQVMVVRNIYSNAEIRL